jgi:hypothetical protein
MAILITVAALVLSVIISPLVFIGFLVASAVFAVLRAGWRWLRDQP